MKDDNDSPKYENLRLRREKKKLEKMNRVWIMLVALGGAGGGSTITNSLTGHSLEVQGEKISNISDDLKLIKADVSKIKDNMNNNLILINGRLSRLEGRFDSLSSLDGLGK